MKLKRIIIVLFVLILLFSINTRVYAIGRIIEEGKDFLGASSESSTKVIEHPEELDKGIQGISGFIFNIFIIIGILFATYKGLTIGLEFVRSGIDSRVDSRVDAKKALVVFLIGAILLFGAYRIWAFGIEWGRDVFGTPKSTSSSKTETQTEQSTSNGDTSSGKSTIQKQDSGRINNGGVVSQDK